MRTRQALALVRLTTVHLVSPRGNIGTQGELLGLRLALSGIPRKPALATATRPIFSKHASLLPGADPSNVQFRIERVPRLHVPPLPKHVAVTERGATTRSCRMVRTTLHGICVVILAHPHSPEHHGTFFSSQTLSDCRANARAWRVTLRQVGPSRVGGRQTGRPRALRSLA